MSDKKLGSYWSIWDLQVQTILDDDYIELKKYYEELKTKSEEKWTQFIELVGTEEDALLWDSKEYFNSGDGSEKSRTDNYAKVLFSFLEVYNPELGCMAITDHNHIHPTLMDSLWKYSQKTSLKIIPGVEVNSGGVHMLLLFGKPPCKKESYSEGIKTFLATIGVVNRKDNGDYMLTDKSVADVMDEVKKEKGIVIFAHCNSDNGLFQERGKTDRTHLANIYNKEPIVLLQGKNQKKLEKLSEYIKGHEKLDSIGVCHTASDARKLTEIGGADDEGLFQYIKGEPGFEGLRQAMFEHESRMRASKETPVYPIHKIETLNINLPEDTTIGDDKFCLTGEYNIKIHPNFTCFIGGRGTGKSTFLNLIHEKVSPGKNKFFSSKKIKVHGKTATDLAEYIQLDGDNDHQDVEFISQNEIESFATDQNLLTDALFSRIKRLSGGRLTKSIENLSEAVENQYEFIDLLVQQSKNTESKKQKNKEIESKRKILSSFESEEYKKHEKVVSEKSTEYSTFLKSKERYELISKKLKELYNNNLQFLETDFEIRNKYDEKVKSAQEVIQKLVGEGLKINSDEVSEIEENLKKTYESAKEGLREYLEGKGLTEESMNDVSEANKAINDLEIELKDLTDKEKVINNKITEFKSKLVESSDAYKKEIKESIKQLNEKLTNLSEQVKKIELKLNVSDEKIKERVFEDLKEKLEMDWSSAGTKETTIRDYLFKIELDDVLKLDKDDFIEKIIAKKKTLTKAQEYLVNQFSSDVSLVVYKEIITVHQRDRPEVLLPLSRL